MTMCVRNQRSIHLENRVGSKCGVNCWLLIPHYCFGKLTCCERNLFSLSIEVNKVLEQAGCWASGCWASGVPGRRGAGQTGCRVDEVSGRRGVEQAVCRAGEVLSRRGAGQAGCRAGEVLGRQGAG